jgi:hypothetical protein
MAIAALLAEDGQHVAGVEVWAEEMPVTMAKQRESDASPERAKEGLRMNGLPGFPENVI